MKYWIPWNFQSASFRSYYNTSLTLITLLIQAVVHTSWRWECKMNQLVTCSGFLRWFNPTHIHLSSAAIDFFQPNGSALLYSGLAWTVQIREKSAVRERIAGKKIRDEFEKVVNEPRPRVISTISWVGIILLGWGAKLRKRKRLGWQRERKTAVSEEASLEFSLFFFFLFAGPYNSQLHKLCFNVRRGQTPSKKMGTPIGWVEVFFSFLFASSQGINKAFKEARLVRECNGDSAPPACKQNLFQYLPTYYCSCVCPPWKRLGPQTYWTTIYKKVHNVV